MVEVAARVVVAKVAEEEAGMGMVEVARVEVAMGARVVAARVVRAARVAAAAVNPEEPEAAREAGQGRSRVAGRQCRRRRERRQCSRLAHRRARDWSSR